MAAIPSAARLTAASRFALLLPATRKYRKAHGAAADVDGGRWPLRLAPGEIPRLVEKRRDYIQCRRHHGAVISRRHVSDARTEVAVLRRRRRRRRARAVSGPRRTGQRGDHAPWGEPSFYVVDPRGNDLC